MENEKHLISRLFCSFFCFGKTLELFPFYSLVGQVLSGQTRKICSLPTVFLNQSFCLCSRQHLFCRHRSREVRLTLYHFLGYVSRLVFCFLRKIKAISSLMVIKKRGGQTCCQVNLRFRLEEEHFGGVNGK